MVIEQIRKRTRSGVGVTPGGKEYKLDSRPYSRKYARDKGQTNVDLTLSGDMLENMYVKSTSSDKITISVSPEDYGKLRGAEEGIRRIQRDSNGNPIMTNGHTVTKDIVKRPFFHLSNGDVDKIISSKRFIDTFKRAVKRALEK